MAGARWRGRCARHRGWWREGERGDANISAVLLWPAVLAIVWLSLQTGLWMFARQVALSAAEQGAQAARAQPVSTARADTAATGFMAAAGRGLVTDPAVTTSITGGSMRVQVTGKAISLLPGVTFTIHQESVQPLERITP